jgi:type II secretory pathway pseudopilin PulG
MRGVFRNQRGQVWVETVVYTLIGLAIIGILIATTAPQIEKMKDNAFVEQSMESLGKMSEKIYEVQGGAGNQRSFTVSIGKGKLVIDAENDIIYWDIDASFQYSESGVSTPSGILNVTTLGDDPWVVRLEMDFPMDITYNGEDEQKEFGESPTPYKFTIKNEGVTDGKIVVNIREVA